MRLSIRLVALVLAGVLGLAGGTATALLIDTEPNGKETSSADPLGLGVELANLECTGQKLLVIGFGDAAAALDSAIADNRDSSVHYLETADSCDTLYGRENGPPPEYAAYLGPFDSFGEACELRMTIHHRGDQVTVLKSGNVQVVRCACHLDARTFPVLTPGMAPDAETTSWVRALQQLLVDIDDELFPPSRVTGFYDDATVARVRELQDHTGETGIVDLVTWSGIKAQVCNKYSY